MAYPLVGLVGYPRSGKDALAKALVEGYSWKRRAFADPLKQMVLGIFPAYARRAARWDCTPLEALDRCKMIDPDTRPILQNLGMILRERAGLSYWLDQALPAGREVPARTVFTDVRFANEGDRILRNGGLLIGIDRPGYGPVNDHASEQGTTKLLERADTILTNDGSLGSLVASFLHVISCNVPL